MSKPQNPLNLFRSYSYHHILIACDGTETAEALARESEITAFDHERAERRFCPQTLRNGNGRYVVLINGLSDTQFTVRSASWASVLIPNESTNEGSTHFRTMAVDGEIIIQEPLGVNFLNLLNDVTKSLGTDPNGVCFVLKTIFVGHRDDGTTEWITNVRPILFLAYDISAIFDVTGAEYTFAFVGVVNGAARLPHHSSVADGFTLKIEPGSSLRSAIEDQLSTELNRYYDAQKKQIQAEAECSGLDFDFEDEFVDVEYKVVLHPDYYDFTVGTAEPPNKQDKDDDDPIVEIKGNSTSIEGIIDLVMRSSREVLEEDQKDNKERFMYKITSSLKTGPERYIVEYEVQRYKAAVIPSEEIFTFEPPTGPTGKPQGIEFDYIFTGRNIDIQTFDLKMQMGMAFFQTLSTSSSVPTNASNVIKHYNPQPYVTGTGNLQGPGDQQKNSSCELDVRNENKRRKKPFFLGMSLKNSNLRNNRVPAATASYNTLLARHAAYENIEARMTIRGNPQLLEETTQLPSYLDPTVDLATADANAKPGEIVVPEDAQLPEEERNRAIMPAIHRIPGYVKVNVFMPNSSTVNDPNDLYNNDYAQNFWYPGWYFLYSITHTFSEGEFTQELEMFSLPTDASQQNLNNNTDKRCSDVGSGSSNEGASSEDQSAIKSTVEGKQKDRAASSNQQENN